MADVPAHDQAITHRYVVHFPEHEPRHGDPHLHDFQEWKRREKAAGRYHCRFAVDYRDGDESECDLTHPLEAHHCHIEFALQNGVSFDLLEQAFPGISKQSIGAWIDADPNLELLCVFHHRGHGGKHVASVSDFEGEKFVRGLIS